MKIVKYLLNLKMVTQKDNNCKNNFNKHLSVRLGEKF